MWVSSSLLRRAPSPACGGGLGRGQMSPPVFAAAPSLSLPGDRAFTPVFDGLCGGGDARAAS